MRIMCGCVRACMYVQALDGSSQLYKAYSEHLSTAMEFYTHLLSQLEEHYQLPVTAMDYSNLSGPYPHMCITSRMQCIIMQCVVGSRRVTQLTQLSVLQMCSGRLASVSLGVSVVMC